MSPRRSSRARITQPTPSIPHQSNSSSSSISSGRAPLNTNSNRDPPSQRSSVTARSQSSEDPEGTPKPQARRTRSSQEVVKDEATHAIEDEIEDEAEEEVTRCICGNQEYPGLPVVPNDTSKGSAKGDTNPAAFAEDATGWFIQCDGCKVWQHGGCVGLMDEHTSPEEYFCEQCRQDLHKITIAANGRKYSYYLPGQEADSPQSSPAPTPKDNSKKPRDSRASQVNAEHISKGRRSTMNSRDAAYEEEQLRRAIEESKREGGASSTTTGIRKGKRSRNESEDRKEDTKRQRTTSGSASSNSHSISQRPAPESDDEAGKPERFKNIRGAAARNHRNKEVRDREAQRERERADGGGRKRRVGRERDDESDPSPEPLSRTTSARGTKITSTPFIAPPPPDHPPHKTSHKKNSRPPAKRGGRVGRNQYTKDRDLSTHNDLSTTTISPAPSNSSQNPDGSVPHINGNGNVYAETNGLGKPSKPHRMNPNRTTMNDMKRRVAGILEFISHTQVELAGTEPPSTTKSSTSTNTPPDSNGSTNGRGDISGKAVNAALEDLEGIDEQAFNALSSFEMMEVLTRRLMRWQGEYGKWGEK
ncbi:hypothetical protein ABVK25_005973 [Lepraria finkii]|uniref:Zinc finger PHD-type domain-containing protein n=1 Tax=Lepraria finkii TaxID=1340010 RepID=A0ABR4B727_9LECA